MDVGPPELLAEDLEPAVGPQVAGELVDREVEAHPRSDAVDRGEADAGRGEGRRVEAEQRLLDRDLLLRVERHGRELAVLGDRDQGIGHAAVVRARRGEDEAIDAGVRGVLDQGHRGDDVDGLARLRIARARRVADDRREMHDRVGAAQRLGAGVGVADVGDEQLDAALAQRVRAALLVVQERVEHADLVRGRQQLLGDQHADVPGPAGDQRGAVHGSHPSVGLYRIPEALRSSAARGRVHGRGRR